MESGEQKTQSFLFFHFKIFDLLPFLKNGLHLPRQQRSKGVFPSLILIINVLHKDQYLLRSVRAAVFSSYWLRDTLNGKLVSQS